jgi:predicted dehydrogenase
MGSAHARYLTAGSITGARLAAVCDIDPKRLETVRGLLPQEVQCFDEADKLIGSDSVDAVMVATPHYDHPPLAVKALNAGKHALVEKPAGVYTRQVREMNEVAEKSDRLFAVMFNQRTNPLYQKVRDLVQSGELGEIKRTSWLITSWYRSQSYYDSGTWRATWAGEGGGVLMNQCPHQLDLWQWMCGVPKTVQASCYFGKFHDIEVEDDVTAFVEYENGATGVFVTSTGDAPGTNRFEISGDRGKLVIENNQCTFYRLRVSERQFNREYKGGFGQPEVWECKIPIKGAGGGHAEVTQNWVNAILKGTPLLAPGVEGIRGLEIANAMLLSTWTNSRVSIPVDEDLYYQELQKRVATSKVKTGESTTLNVDGTYR